MKIYRVGEKTVCSNEMIATIIAYRSYQDIDVQFDDGLVVEHISYARFFQHSIPHPDHKPVFWPYNLKKHIGLKKRTLDGYRELLCVHEDEAGTQRRTYYNSTRIDYVDDDGTVVKNGTYHDFLLKNTSLHKHIDNITKEIVDIIE